MENIFERWDNFIKSTCPNSKAQLLCMFNFEIDNFIERRGHYPEGTFRERKAILDKFKTALEKCKLPQLQDKNCFYNYSLSVGCLELQLCERNTDMDNLEISKYKLHQTDSDYVPNIDFAVKKTLMRIESSYLTVEQFADLHHVFSETVNQWIQHAKLRHAKKQGENWLIPSCESKPHRKFEGVQYLISETLSIEEFPFVSACHSIWIQQCPANRKRFDCIFRNFDDNTCEHLKLNHVDTESLEFALISSGKVKAEVIDDFFQ